VRFSVCFLEENYGKKGVLVLIVPSGRVDVDYLKVIGKNLNETFKFTFGEAAYMDELLGSKSMPERLKQELDMFFRHVDKHLHEASLFELFNNKWEDFKSNGNGVVSNLANKRPNNETSAGGKLSWLNRYNIFSDMRSKFCQSCPFFDLPFNIKTDLDTALANMEAQEFVDLDSGHYKLRRLFSVEGSCLFFRDYLLVTHLNSSITKSVYEFCAHYDLFALTKNGNTNQFHIWKEVHLAKKATPKPRHFLIIVILVIVYVKSFF
jgi:hypothetical protein